MNIPFDHGTGCVFSEDSELLFVPLDLAREIAVIKIGKVLLVVVVVVVVVVLCNELLFLLLFFTLFHFSPPPLSQQCSIQEQLPLHHKDKDILSISAGMKEKYFLTCGSGLL